MLPHTAKKMMMMGGGFSPKNISGLTLWMLGDDLTGSDGDAISSWVSKEGNAYDFTQAGTKRPLLKVGVNGINGHTAVRFDGINDLLVLASAVLSGTSGTILAVYRLRGAVKQFQVIVGSGDEASANRYVAVEGFRTALQPNIDLAQQNADTADGVRGGTALGIGPTYITVFQSSGVAYAMRLNGVGETLTVTSGSNNGDWFSDTANKDNVTIGAVKLNTEVSIFQGDIAEILVYDSAISVPDLVTLENYLATRYSVSLSNLGYFTLSAATQVMVQDQVWEGAHYPHTMSVSKYTADGFDYWCWYGLETFPAGGGVGLARSNDLTTWTKYVTNPVIAAGRWPSVVKSGATFYMSLTLLDGGVQKINLLSSADGITWNTVKTIVAKQPGYDNDGSCLFYNSNDSQWYLYWANVNTGTNYHKIFCRVASAITDLDTASTITVLESADVLASPNIMYYGGFYYLATETVPTGTLWNTNLFVSASPTSGFLQTWDSPILNNSDACFFQHHFGDDVLHGFYSQLAAGAWSMYHRTADLTARKTR